MIEFIQIMIAIMAVAGIFTLIAIFIDDKGDDDL